MNLAELKPNPDNPRIIKDDKFKKLVTSIKDFPKMMALRPMVVANNEVSIWNFDRSVSNEFHPTQKPVGLSAKAIKNHSVGIIADIFSGSGTTMVAGHQLNRKVYAMGIEPKYCQCTIDRMLKLDNSLVIKKNGQPYIINELSTT